MVGSTHNYASYEMLRKSDCVEVAEALNAKWVFRGQTNAEWDLSPSLERGTTRPADRASREAAALKQIKLAASYEETRGLDPTDYFSWLALLQHHGCRTRLLDFTESFYVALYFALRDCPTTDTDSAVWAIATSAMDTRIAEIRAKAGLSSHPEDAARRLVNNSIRYSYRYKGDERLAIVHAKPAHLNQRLIAQQGLFLCPLNLDRSFMENLTRSLGLTGTKIKPKELADLDQLHNAANDEREKVIKIRVKKGLHRDLLFHFRKMNITEATLFPGLDGFARSINYLAMESEETQ